MLPLLLLNPLELVRRTRDPPIITDRAHVPMKAIPRNPILRPLPMLLAEILNSPISLDSPPHLAEVRAMAEVTAMKAIRPPDQDQDAAVRISVRRHQLHR